MLLGRVEDWLRHYTSNRVGEQEINTIISILKDSGIILEDSQGILRWKDFPAVPSVLHKQKKAHTKSQRNLKSEGGPSRGSARIDETEISGRHGSIAPADPQERGAGSPRAGFKRLIFRSLGRIIDAIAAVSLPSLAPSCRYEEGHYDGIGSSEVQSSQHRVDGYLHLLESTINPPVLKTAKMPAPDVANRRKAIHSACHTLHSDCRRKHTYSITMEDNRMILWYFSRSHSAQSMDFDFLDVRAVVWALSSLIFSTAEDLGYDADIRRITEKDERTNTDHVRYIYRLGGTRFFKTLKCIDEYDNRIIPGRATRVWEVVEVRSFDDTRDADSRRVLRDVWLDYGADTEGEIQAKIFQRCEDLAANFPGDDDPRLHNVDEKTRGELRQRLQDASYKELFLTIEADHRGARCKPAAEEFSPAPNVFAKPAYATDEGVARRGSDAHRSSGHESEYYESEFESDSTSSGSARQRNFVVYKEVCRALHELDDLHTVAQAMLDCVLAIQILFLIGWIHRDISSGNLLCYNGRGKLSDLEYAGEFDGAMGSPGHSSNSKTGTPIFMAVEVQSGSAIYTPIEDVPQCLRMEGILQMKDALQPAGSGPIRHNFQHDLESFFWILTWLVVARVAEGQDQQHPSISDAATTTLTLLFDRATPGFLMNRRNFLLDRAYFDARLRCLRPEDRSEPSDVPGEKLYGGLFVMRTVLRACYMNRQLRFDDVASYAPAYALFREVLQDIAAAVRPGKARLGAARLAVGPLRSPLPPQKSGRAVGVSGCASPRNVASLKRKQGRSDDDVLVRDGPQPEKRHRAEG
ncbi:hypothetical protein C8Q79DRAFT_1101288 [Trametes meyenii]|nr:hypothetical protein C8Q79DRAFT_1101288 [Trametes meyenii]